MAKLEYDETGRLLFTQEMRKEYTILIPQMLPIHFGFFAKLLARSGYNVAILNNDGKAVVDSGLKYVHNDTCYPALLVIGQMIDAISTAAMTPTRSPCSSPRPAAAAGPPTTSTCSARPWKRPG